MSNHIPIVDFSVFSIAHEERPPIDTDAVQQLAANIYDAFSSVGFVYLENHGISQIEIDQVLCTMDAFFSLSLGKKKLFQKCIGQSPNGWDELERERTNLNRPADLKESFDVGAVENKDFNWPSDDVIPNFKSTIQLFYHHLHCLGLRVLSAIAVGLNLDADVFAEFYKNVGNTESATQLRLNYYPKITDLTIKPHQIRCGEHTDYGGITLLIQDDAGGLEVGTVDGRFVPATPIRGTILVNIANLMQRWTSDRLKSTLHRVLIPEEEITKRKSRRSIVFFFDPDYGAEIVCLDGANKYPPVNAGEYIKDLLKKTYKF